MASSQSPFSANAQHVLNEKPRARGGPGLSSCHRLIRLFTRNPSGSQTKTPASTASDENEPGRRAAAGLLTREETRRIALNVAKLPELWHGTAT
jgi:hypothetical protein